MFSPIKWIEPRLKTLCVAFGAADMTFVALSTLCWYFIFETAFQAQHIQELLDNHISYVKDADDVEDVYKHEGNKTKLKEERSPDELRLERTIRACGFNVNNSNNHLVETDTSNYAGPAALIGAAMGGYFILGALLMSLNSVRHPAARQVMCTVALIGEGISTFYLFIGVTIISSNVGLCRTEYYFEYFRPILILFVGSIIFIFTYKTYEVTIISFYLGQQIIAAKQEKQEVQKFRHSMLHHHGAKHPTPETVEKKSQRGPVGPQTSSSESDDSSEDSDEKSMKPKKKPCGKIKQFCKKLCRPGPGKSKK